MIYLLYIALGFLAATSCILFWNYRTFSALRSLKNYVLPTSTPKVSICIPARNEALNIERCLRSVLNQQYPDLEVLVLDDHSTDGTPRILSAMSQNYPNRLTVIKGRPKPDDWLGKPWACHQLSKKASGSLFIFIDADVWLEPQTVTRAVRTMGGDVLDFLTVWPQQKLESFWEKTIVPLVYYAVFTLLPVAYIKNTPKWMPKILRKKTGPMFVAASGQFMAFKKDAYAKIGGHQSVKDEIVEDVALAKNIKKNQLSMNMYNGINSVYCRMYRSQQEIYEGFRKNFLAGFNYNIPLFLAMALLHIIVFLVPALGLLLSLLTGQLEPGLLSGAAMLVVILHRLLLAKWFGWQFLYSITHMLGVGWFQKLGIRVIKDHFGEDTATWKGRTLFEKKK